jgi:hypothetical protein
LQSKYILRATLTRQIHFIEAEDELLFFSRDHKNIALADDFNSRTSNVSDIVELDENLFDIC